MWCNYKHIILHRPADNLMCQHLNTLEGTEQLDNFFKFLDEPETETFLYGGRKVQKCKQ